MMLNPRPDSEELEQHYQHSGYSPHMQSAHSPAERLQQAAHQLLLSWRAAVVLKGLNKEREETRLLEIGCATGTLLGTLHRKNGLQRKHLTGIEPDRESAAYARERYGLRILHALGELAENEKGYDRIVLWHTLEHIDDLHATLQEMERLLAPDGKIILALPNPFSYDAQHYGHTGLHGTPPDTSGTSRPTVFQHCWHSMASPSAILPNGCPTPSTTPFSVKSSLQQAPENRTVLETYQPHLFKQDASPSVLF